MDKTEYEFPQTVKIGEIVGSVGGLLLRDYFAAKAMVMMYESDDDQYMEVIAALSYEMADEMMEARKK